MARYEVKDMTLVPDLHAPDVAVLWVTTWRLFGKNTTEVVPVFGSCTVWQNQRTGARLPTHVEALLADAWGLARRNKGIA